jgi:thioredoxin reductase (NADPH)
MESLIVWGVALLLVGIVFVPYVLKFRKKQKQDHARKQEAMELGADKPIAQYPQIDEMQCIGCGACVMACPEGDVLGIVHGKATVINGLKCVGHGRCAEACPVSGIVVGLGDIKKRDDIPFMNEFNETNVPGIYISGELGGLALIKNAISQGEMVVNDIAKTITPSINENTFDIVIVGAGPSGISAGLAALKHNLSCIILDQQGFGGTILQYPRKKLVMTRPIEIPLYGMLDKPEYEKEELLAIWEEIQSKFNLNFELDEKLEQITKNENYFDVKTQNSVFSGQRVVLALGRRGTPRKLGVPGEDKAKVMYKLIDAESYNNNHIFIVGGGDSALEAAIGLAHQPGNVVTVSYRKSKFFRSKKKNEQRINEMISAGRIKVLFDSSVAEIRDANVVLQQAEKEIDIANDFVFVFAGGVAPFKLLKQFGIAFGDSDDDNVNVSLEANFNKSTQEVGEMN